MKRQKKGITQQQLRQLCVLTAVAAGLLAIWRTALTPTAFEQPLPYGIMLGVTVVLTAVLLTLCALKKPTPITVGGRAAHVSAAAAALTGAALLAASAVIAHEWFTLGIMPYPKKLVISNTDTLLIYLWIFVGLASAAFFLLLAVNWWCAGVCRRRFMPLLALAPVVWSWVRLIRYITSHVSSLGLFRNMYDLGMIVFEMLFFVALARYVGGVAEKPTRFFIGLSLCTGLLCTIGAVTQVSLFLKQDLAAFETCALVMAPDFGVAALAFVTAFAQGYGIPCEDDATQVEKPQGMENDGTGAEYLISDEWFMVPNSEDD